MTDSQASQPKLTPQQIRIEARCGPLLAPVLRRIVGMLAAQEGFGVDRLNGALAVVDSLNEAACKTIDGQMIGFELTTGDSAIAIDVGPLDSGVGEILTAHVRAGEPVAVALLDELSVEQSSDRDCLAVRVSA